MGLHQFNENKFLLKLRFNKNKSKYIKYGTITIGIILILFAVIYFSFSKYTVSNKYSVIETTVGDFSKTKNLITYLSSIQANNTDTMSYDGTSDNNLRYYGSNPNNYITYNGELWRIIGVMNNMTTSDGKTTSLVKIVRANSIGSLAWDSTNVNDWSTSTLKNILNSGAYYSKTTGTDTQYNPSVQTISVDFTNNGLSASSKKMIANVVWKLGGWNTNAVTATNMYTYEKGTTVFSGHSTSWTGQVGLMSASDYGFASSACYQNKTLDTYSTCTTSNWLYSGYDEWLLTPMSGYVHSAYRIMSGNLNYYYGSGLGCNGGYPTRPALYLNSNVLLNDGVGTSSSPYIIEIN